MCRLARRTAAASCTRQHAIHSVIQIDLCVVGERARAAVAGPCRRPRSTAAAGTASATRDQQQEEPQLAPSAAPVCRDRGNALCQTGSEKPPSTTSTWPRIISASGEQRNATAAGDVVGLDEPARRVRAAGAEHLLLVREVLERAGLDDAGRDGVDADPARRELDREVADERLERRLRDADQRVVLEHALRAERGDRDDRRRRPASAARRPGRARATRGRSRSSVQSQCLSSVSSAGRTTPVAALWTSTSSGPSAATSVEHAVGRDVAADEHRLGAGRAQLLGRRLGRLVVAEVADRDALRRRRARSGARSRARSRASRP